MSITKEHYPKVEKQYVRISESKTRAQTVRMRESQTTLLSDIPTARLIDHFNFRHRQTKQNYIEVKPKEADIAAVFRSHESYETWEEIEGTESDLALADMHGKGN